MNSLKSMKDALRPLGLYNLGEDSFISRELSCYAQFLDEVGEAIDSLLTEGFLQTAGEEGIAQVENPAPFAGGADEEDDETLRERLLAAYASVANGTNAAYYYNLAMSFPFVRSAHVIPRKRGRGTVDITVDVGSSDTGRLLEISDAVASQREIGVDAAVSQAEAKSVSVSVSLTAASGFIPEQVEEAAQAALEDFGGRLGVSQPLKLIDLYTCLIHIQGVDNFQVTAPDSDVIPTETQVIRPTFTVTAKGGEDL